MRNTATKLRKILQVSKKIENVEVKIKKNKTKKYLSLYDYLQEEYTTNYYRFP